MNKYAWTNFTENILMKITMHSYDAEKNFTANFTLCRRVGYSKLTIMIGLPSTEGITASEVT